MNTHQYKHERIKCAGSTPFLSDKTMLDSSLCKTNSDKVAISGLASAMFATTLLAGLILTSISVSADNTDVVDEINITVPVSCTLSGTGQNSHNAEINNGLYQPDIGSTTLHAFCNDNEGFAIYAAGYTGNEVGGTNSNKLVGTSASSNATIESGVATTAGNPDVSNWAMKLAISQDSGDTTGTNAFTIDSAPNVALPSQAESGATQAPFSNYHVVPNEYTKVAHKNSGTDMAATTGGVKLTTTYAAYISKTQPADTYSGQVIYTLVHPESAEAPLSPQPSTAGCINYHANASNAIGTMGCQSATDNASVTLLASNFSRAGYGFAGWSDAYDYATNPNAKFYGPQETITAPVGTTANGLSLYAVWVKSEGNLQSWSGCSSLTKADEATNIFSESITALSDSRDNNTYAVARLADGNCWMIENLRLDNTGTDNTNGSLSQGYGGQFAGLAYPEAAWADNITTANSLYSTDGSDNTINIGTINASYRFPRYNNLNTPSDPANRPQNPTSNTFTNDSTTVGMYSYGNYYTWAAAIADTTVYSSGDHGTTSICPTGWKLPIGDQSTTDKSFGALSVALGGPANGATANSSSTPTGTVMSGIFRSYPNNFVYSGYVYSGSVNNRGSFGSYWSSTALSSNFAYYLFLHSSLVYPGTDSYEMYLGGSVRCVVSGA